MRINNIFFLVYLIFFSCSEKSQIDIIRDCDKLFKPKILFNYPRIIDSIVLQYSKKNNFKDFKYVVQFPLIINECKALIDSNTIIVTSKCEKKTRCIFTFIKSNNQYKFIGVDSTINSMPNAPLDL